MPEEFIDVTLPAAIWGYPCFASPRTSTTIARADGGAEQRNRNRLHPLHVYRLPDAIRAHAVIEDLRDHWMVMSGPLTAFPWRDPLDFASVRLAEANLVPTLTPTDSALGTGDGARTTFQLVKHYTRGAYSYSRPIRLPDAATVRVAIDGVEQMSGWSVSRPGGVVTFTAAPGSGLAVTAGFLFDVPVRFSSDEDFDGIVQSFQTTGAADLTLMETRLCL